MSALAEPPANFSPKEVEMSPDGELDFSLIDYCLSLTPWERMLANDAALNFAEELQEAMRRHNGQS